MKLKCVGGLYDGKIVDSRDAKYAGERVRISVKRRCDIINSIEEFNKLPESITYQYVFYKIEKFNFKNPDYELTFLIPVDWTMPEAIQHLLASHHGI